jgi:hypothetical protein
MSSKAQNTGSWFLGRSHVQQHTAAGLEQLAVVDHHDGPVVVRNVLLKEDVHNEVVASWSVGAQLRQEGSNVHGAAFQDPDLISTCIIRLPAAKWQLCSCVDGLPLWLRISSH